MKKSYYLFIFLIFSCSVTYAEKLTYGNAVISEVTSVYDADTFTVNIDNWPDIIGSRIRIRVFGIDTPEMKGKCKEEKSAAKLAKQHTVDALRKAKIIEIQNISRGKYFRILANVYIDGKNLAHDLIENGHAIPYMGGKRVNWCNN